MASEIDRALLRRYEPVVRYTQGEQFYPMAVEPYVASSSLWAQQPGKRPVRLAAEGELSPERLGEHSADIPNALYFLRFIEPLNITDMAASKLPWRRTPDSRQFHAGRGRLARVGYVSRFADALFSLSLLARGRVPGDTSAAAAIAYQRMLDKTEAYHYHGRVVRQGDWIVLQYWFFYAYNNWRSRFFGANDHESDWEMVCVYLAERPDRVASVEDPLASFEPEWIAYASHDYHGDNLRRRWDDDEVQKEDGHPIIYAGAGSHASYFSAGEYLTELELPFLAPFARLSAALGRFWRKQLRQYALDDKADESRSSIFNIPFVDYARGDGLSIGPGQAHEWDEPRVLSPLPAWVSGYRGLWGLYANDPFSGEDAPAGPMYNRDGTVRKAWYDPVGWAGLERVVPHSTALRVVREREQKIRQRQHALRNEIERTDDELLGVGAQFEATRNLHHLVASHQAYGERLTELSGEADEQRGEMATNQAMLDALVRYGKKLESGWRGPLRDHITRAHQPAPAGQSRQNWLFEIWAAVSIGLMMLIIVGLAYFSPRHLAIGLVIIIALFTFIEAGFRGRLVRVVTSVTLALAVVAFLVLLYEFFWEIVVLAVLITGAYILFENLREIFR